LLVARGLTNRQIAEELIIGERTVDTHVTNIRTKLELHRRVQITAWRSPTAWRSRIRLRRIREVQSATDYRIVRDQHRKYAIGAG